MIKETKQLKRMKRKGFIEFLESYGIMGEQKQKILSKKRYLKQLEPIFNSFIEEQKQ